MESKIIKAKFTNTGNIIEVTANKELLKHILLITSKEGKSHDDLYTQFGFNKTTIWSALNNSKGVTTTAVDFIQKVGEWFIKAYGNKYVFHQERNIFITKSVSEKKEFRNGIYYGFFKKDNETDTYHFVLLIDNQTIKIRSEYGIAEGDLQLYDSTYSALLVERYNERKQMFLIGKKSSNIDRKFFTTTWSSHDNDVFSALCCAIFIPNSPYKTIEEIHKAGKVLRTDMLAKTPNFMEKFFKEQKCKFLKKENSKYEYDDE